VHWRTKVGIGSVLLITTVNVYTLAAAGQWLGCALAVSFMIGGLIHFGGLHKRESPAADPVLGWVIGAQVVFGFWSLAAEDLRECERAAARDCCGSPAAGQLDSH
jgi:hypothetical protein